MPDRVVGGKVVLIHDFEGELAVAVACSRIFHPKRELLIPRRAAALLCAMNFRILKIDSDLYNAGYHV